VPAAIGEYRISPTGQSIGKSCATIKASIRDCAPHFERLADKPSTV
jgi:hypothetical protein